MRILLIEDDTVLGAAVRDQIAADGHSADWMTRLDQARDAMAGAAYDLVLLDVLLPGMDGREVADELRSNAMSASVPIVLLTGLVTPEMEDKAKRFQAAGFVSKESMQREEFVRTVTRVLATHPG